MIPKLPKRQRRKFKKLLATCVTFATLALASGELHAEPITIAIVEVLMYAGATYGTATAIAAAVVSFAVSSALSYAVGALTRPSTGGYRSSAMSNRTHMVRSSVAPRNMVYGRCMVSGPLAFIATTNTGDGPNGVGGTTRKGGENGLLHMVVVLANHEIDAVEEVYLGDEPLGFMSMVGNKPQGGKYGGITKQGESVTMTFTMPANSAGVTLGGLGAESILGLVEVGTAPDVLPSGGESGVDAFGNPILPNGGTAAIDLPFTFVNANRVTTPGVDRQRTLALTYLSKGIVSSYVDCYAHLGSPSQSANALLMASCPDRWTTAHRLQGIAYLYLRLGFDPKVFPNGIPNVKALIRGKKVRDPRDPLYPADTAKWTANYALCALDYLKSADGLGCTDADLDLDQIKVAANICDETVTIRPGLVGVQGVGVLPVTQKRYEAHGTLLLDHDVEENLRSLSTAGGGPVPLLVSGRFQIPVGYYGTPVAPALTESDLRAAVKVRPRTSRRDLFNAVGGTYVDGRISWQPTDFPEVANSFYQSQDGGEKIRRDVTFPFTTDEIMAQRLAKIMLERSRQGITIDWPGKPSCFRLSVGDLVPVTLAKFGWNAKVFRVIAWSMESNGTIDLVLQEDATGVYDWNYGQATTTDLSKDTDLPDPSYITPVGALTLYSDSSELVRTGDGTIVSRLHVIWPASTDAGVVNGGEFQVQYKKASETFWTPWDKVSGAFNETWIFPVVDTEVYFVRVRAVNSRGIETDWVYAKHKIIGNSLPPPDVITMTVTVRADGTRSFTWPTANQPVNVTNGGGYRIRYRVTGSGVAWPNMTPLHTGLLSQSPYETNNPPAGTYDFGIEAVNSSRTVSTAPAFIIGAKIGTEPVSYGVSANLLYNSDWQLWNGLGPGWINSSTHALHGWRVTPETHPIVNMGRNFQDGWNPGRGGAWIYDNATVTGTTKYHYIDQEVAVAPNTQYEISALVALQRCAAMLRVHWLDAARNEITFTTGQTRDVGGGTDPSRTQGFAGMTLLWDKVTAPSNAAIAIFRVFKYATNSGNADSYLFLNRAMMCVARAGSTRESPTPWIESGFDLLHGGSLQSGSVDSAQVAAEAATSFRVVDGNETGYISLNPAAPTSVNAVGYVAPVDCVITVNASVRYASANERTGSPGVGTVLDQFAFGIAFNATSTFAYEAGPLAKQYVPMGDPLPGTVQEFNAVITRTFSMTKGQSISANLFGSGGTAYSSGGGGAWRMYVRSSQMRMEVIKR